MKYPFFASVLSIGLGIGPSGCTSTQAYRVPIPTPQIASADTKTSYSLEEYSYQTDKTVGHYYIGFVEFDDQGWYQNERQQTVLLSWLKAQHQTSPQENFLIVAYAHGWKHNAQPDDDDVKNFKVLLHGLAVQEDAAHANNPHHFARKVIGVYLGWRGESIPIPLVHDATFWTRKNAAERVGRRSAKNLLMSLNQFRAYANGWCSADHLASPAQTQLIFLGHSFGAQLMYNALQTEITDRALRLNRDGNYRTAKSFGDFVLLVNPAFEGAEYESLWQAALMRQYPQWQKPVMAIVTSSADWATGLAFPAGRIYTLTQAAPHPGERDTVMFTVGHLERYRTHTLTAPSALATAPPPEKHDLHTAVASFKRILSLKSVPSTPGESVSYEHGILTKLNNPENVPYFPYLSIYTDASMIQDHSDIWNDNFRSFMLEFLTRQVMDHEIENETVSSCSGAE